MKINIEIDNITEAQKIAIEDMMAQWQRLGDIGSSRWTLFFADGDGNFRPNISIDGDKPKHTDYISKETKWGKIKFPMDKNMDEWSRPWEVYKMDFDAIAWKIRTKNESNMDDIQ